MPVLTEQPSMGDVLKYEVNPNYTREVITLLIGILVVAAAVAWVYCRNAGYRGFTGDIQAVRGPWGIKIGVKLGCY